MSPIDELKHSIRTHMVLAGGATQQLAVFLLKVIDLIEDTDSARRDKETLNLAFSIVEASAIFIQQSVDKRSKEATKTGQHFPPRIQAAADNIMVVLGKNRNHSDKIAAKTAVLYSIAVTLNELSSFTKAAYPKIYDSNGNVMGGALQT